jgi:hypothetical protein
VDVEHTPMLHLSTEYYVKRVLPQCTDVEAIHKIPSVCIDMEATGHNGALRGPSVETVPILCGIT